jgi:hypothetical protein
MPTSVCIFSRLVADLILVELEQPFLHHFAPAVEESERARYAAVGTFNLCLPSLENSPVIPNV